MFTSRQYNELYLEEVGFSPLSPGAITTGSFAVYTANCYIINPQFAANSKMTFNLGDTIEVFSSTGTPFAGLIIQAWPNGTQGQLTFALYNASGGTITLTTQNLVIVAKRLPANIT